MNQKLPVVLSDRAGERSAHGILNVRVFSLEERRARAIKFGGGAFALGIFCVVLPLVHFVLVPFFIILSPFLVRYFLKQDAMILNGTGKCPNCGAEFTFAKRQPKFPFDDVCTSCRQAVRVNEAARLTPVPSSTVEPST